MKQAVFVNKNSTIIFIEQEFFYLYSDDNKYHRVPSVGLPSVNIIMQAFAVHGPRIKEASWAIYGGF